jgi:hypothetical protein
MSQAKLNKEVQNEAAENHIDAQINGGEILARESLHGGYRHGESRSSSSTLTLEELGVSKYESQVWQRLASANRDTIHDR